MLTSEQRKRAYAFLSAMDIMPTEEALEHLEVLMEVMALYESRTEAYGQIWKQYGALSNLLSAARKTDRTMETWWHDPGDVPLMHKDALDDALDSINYFVFFIRNVRAMNITGTVPKRPKAPF